MGTTLAEHSGQNLETSGSLSTFYTFIHSFMHPSIHLFVHSFILARSLHAMDKDAGARVLCVTAQEVSQYNCTHLPLQPFKCPKDKVGPEQAGLSCDYRAQTL